MNGRTLFARPTYVPTSQPTGRPSGRIEGGGGGRARIESAAPISFGAAAGNTISLRFSKQTTEEFATNVRPSVRRPLARARARVSHSLLRTYVHSFWVLSSFPPSAAIALPSRTPKPPPPPPAFPFSLLAASRAPKTEFADYNKWNQFP